jgi:hypothetical protein
MARFTVLGFTEAELGFVLAALFVAVSGYQIVEARGATDEAFQAANVTQAVQDSLLEARDGLSRVQDSLQVAREELENLRRLTSRLTPYCSERGETDQPVARITVLGSRSYRIDGADLPIAGVTARLAPWLEISRAKSCRFGVEVIPAAGLAAADFMRAREPLSRLFYFR